MQYKNTLLVHVPVIIGLLVIHYFSTDILGFFYLNSLKKRLNELGSGKLTIYEDGNYEPIAKGDSRFKLPRHPKLVIVKRNQNITKEIYFTKYGERIEALYIDNKIKSVSYRFALGTVGFLIPIIGLLIGLYSVIHEMVRTGDVMSWTWTRHPDDYEKICYLYAISLIGFGLLLLVMKHKIGGG